MALDYDDDLYDEDDDLDEDEREDRREERRFFLEAKRIMGQRIQAAQEAYIAKLFTPGTEYKTGEDEGIPWLVENFLPNGSLVILGGNSKSGKTCLATALAMAVANGEPFLGYATKRSPVLWCAFEESRSERLQLLEPFGDLPEHLYTSHNGFKVDTEFGEKALQVWAASFRNPPLIVIDPLFGATDANLAEGRAARKALMGLKLLAAKTMATVLVIHHVNKDTSAGLTRERFAESNQILATASMDLLMDSARREDGSYQIRLQGRGRGAHANRTWLIHSTGPTDFRLVGDAGFGASKTDLKCSSIVAELGKAEAPMTTETLAEACNLRLQTLRNLLGDLVKSGQVVVAAREGKRKLYALPSS